MRGGSGKNIRTWTPLAAVAVGTALLALFLVLFTSCRGEAPAEDNPDKKLTLKITGMWGGTSIPGKDARSVREEAQRAIFERFLELNPSVEFDAQTGLRISEGAGSEAGALMAMAGGTAGEIMYVNFRALDQYVRERFLYPLDEYVIEKYKEMAKLPADAEVSLEDVDPWVLGIHPEVWKVIYYRNPYDGKRHVYSIPYRIVIMAMFYRKDFFREVGLDPDKPPASWEELKDAAFRLTDPVKGRTGIQLSNSGWILTDFIWQAGGEVVRETSDGNWEACFNTPAAVTALRFWRDLMTTEKAAVDPRTGEEKTAPIADSTLNFSDGKAGIRFNYTDEFMIQSGFGSVNPEAIGIALMPPGPTGILASEINAAMWGMNGTLTGPENKKRRDMAWNFIWYQASNEAKRIQTKIFVEAGYAMFVNPKYLEMFGYEEYLDEVPKGWIEANRDAFKYGRPEPYGKNCRAIYLMMNNPIQRVTADKDAVERSAFKPGTPEYDEDIAYLQAVLDRSVRETNRKMIGNLPPELLKRHRIYARFVVGAIFIIFTFMGYKFFRNFTRITPTKETRIVSRLPMRTHLYAFAFMGPALLVIAVWKYYPLLRGSVMAFEDYRILGGSTFCGLDNFIAVFNSRTFWIAVYNTFKYVTLSLVLGFFVPIFLAIMLNEIPVGGVFFRVVYYLPAVMSGLVVAFLWKWMYSPASTGLLNQLIGLVGIGPQKWLGDPKLAMLCVIVPGIWARAGPGCLIYLAALKAVPEEIYEAADLDGAGALHKIFHITLPYLKALILINFVGAFIGAFHTMQNIFVMTGGGPDNATHVAGLEVWLSAFAFLRFGYATAVAWILGSLLIGFTVYQLSILRHARFTTAAQR